MKLKDIDDIDKQIAELEEKKRGDLSNLQANCDHPESEVLSCPRYVYADYAEYYFCKLCGLAVRGGYNIIFKLRNKYETPEVKESFADKFVKTRLDDWQKYALEFPMRHTAKELNRVVDSIGLPLFLKLVNRHKHIAYWTDCNGNRLDEDDSCIYKSKTVWGIFKNKNLAD